MKKTLVLRSRQPSVLSPQFSVLSQRSTAAVGQGPLSPRVRSSPIRPRTASQSSLAAGSAPRSTLRRRVDRRLFRFVTAESEVDPGMGREWAQTEETPRELWPEPPPSRGSSYEAALQLLRCLDLGTSPISWSGSGDRLPPFGLGTPPEGARSDPASETVAGSFGRHRIASMTFTMYASSPA